MAFVWWPSNDIWCRFFVSGEKEWIQLAVTCFPMALCAQVFFGESLVRFVFRMIFTKQLANG